MANGPASDAWRMRDFAQLAVSALGVRRLRARSAETAAVLLEIELLLLAAWDAREAVARPGDGPLAARALLEPALRRVGAALWPAAAKVTLRDAAIDPRCAGAASNLLVEVLFVLTAWAAPRAVEVEAAAPEAQLLLALRYLAEAPGEPDFAQLRRDVESSGGRLETTAIVGGFAITVAL